MREHRLQIFTVCRHLSDPFRPATRAFRSHPGSAEPKTVPAGGKALVDTQLSIAVPLGTYGRVAPRSGLAAKHSIHTGAGVIDADYRGCVFVLLFNLGKEDFVGESRGGGWRFLSRKLDS
jgi:dUTP pyrophosphatase